MNWYNDNEPFAAAWVRNLIACNHLPQGDVDERSILDIEAADLARYRQCHFFAGIGGWPLALRLAGWNAPVWTGSCPCQPFSAAGKRGGFDDKRHLWPVWYELIRKCLPPVIFGEQVASRLGREWLAGVRLDLEALGYAVGCADLCAASVGAPHIRQRLFWVADAELRRSEQCNERQWTVSELDENSGMGDSGSPGLARRSGQPGDDGAQCQTAERAGYWSDSVWLPCTDGKARRTQSRIHPLVDGLPGRVGRLRAYGNAIVPQVAAKFVKAFMETL